MKYINKYDTYSDLVSQQLEVPTLNYVEGTKKLYYKKFGDTSFSVVETALSKARNYEYAAVSDPSTHVPGVMQSENMSSYFQTMTATLYEVWFNNKFKPNNVYQAFQNCASLVGIHNFNMVEVVNARKAFKGCSALATIDGSFNMAAVDNVDDMFSSCTLLASIPVMTNLGAGYTAENKLYHTLDLTPTALTGSTIETNVLAGLANLIDVSAAVTPVIHVTYDQGQAISAAVKAAVAAKGWTLQIDNAPGYSDDQVIMTLSGVTQGATTKLLNSTTGFQAMKVDDGDIETIATTYVFNTDGQHTVTLYCDGNNFGTSTWSSVNTVPFTLQFVNNSDRFITAAYSMFASSKLSAWPNTQFPNVGSGTDNGNFIKCLNKANQITSATVNVANTASSNNAKFQEFASTSTSIQEVTVNGAAPITSFYRTFKNAAALTTVTINGDLSNVESVGEAFYGCSGLTNVSSLTNLGAGFLATPAYPSDVQFDLHWSTGLTSTSVSNIINSIGTVPGSNGQLILANAVQSYVTPELEAAATAKGWTISYQ